MRNYGRIIQDLIKYTTTLPEGDEKTRLTLYLTQAMIVRNQLWNKDQESSAERVLGDLERLSEGQLSLDAAVLNEAMQNVPRYQNNKKKKNK